MLGLRIRQPISLDELLKRVGMSALAGMLEFLDRVRIASDKEILEKADDLLRYEAQDLEFLLVLDYKASHASFQRVVKTVNAEPRVAADIRREVDHYYTRLKDELGGSYFVVLSSQEAAWLNDPQPFGESVANAFPSANFDTDEATRCLAFGRGTACVFHLMRVMEVGLKALGARLAIDTQHKPGWEGVLKKAHGQMSLPNDKKDPDWIKEEDFLSEAVTMLTAVKTAWRNPTMHIEKTYTPEEAERIYDAVRGLMQRLAMKLHEEP